MTDPGDDVEVTEEPIGPLGVLSLVFVVGIAMGLAGGAAQWWLVAGCVPGVAGVYLTFRRRYRAANIAWLICILFGAAAWCAVRQRHIGADDVRYYIGGESQLAQLTGVIVDAPELVNSRKGAMGQFNYEPPGTLFVLDIESPVTGRVLVKIEEADHRLRAGDRVEVRGWLGAIEGPVNPGEYDWRARAAEQGVFGRMTLPTRGNCTVIGVSHRSALARLRQTLSDGASASLRIGMDPHGEPMGLLDALLLGRRGGLPAELSDAFRRTGLAHLLSISGAHLGILLCVTWWVVTLLVPHPRRAAVIVMVVLAMYLLMVPPRVPIVRAGIMAGLFLLGAWSGRRPRGIDLLLLAAVIALIWRPVDLVTAGFQLSFGVVAALLLFVRRVGQLIWPDPTVAPVGDSTGYVAARRGADYLAVNLVAFVAAAPLVMFHFKVLTPLAAPLSVIALPLVTALLAVGFTKILIGLALPSVGLMLAGLLTWLCDGVLRLISHASTWPASTWTFGRSPSAWWVIGALAFAAALLAGWFKERRRAMVMGLCILIAWLAAGLHSTSANAVGVMRVDMIAVGDGSCFVVRVPREESGRPFTFMFDCGSQQYHDVGASSIAPTLRYLGVDRIDAVFLSHADFDHYCGLLDVMDDVTVSKVLMPPQMMKAAEAEPASSTGFLISALKRRDMILETVSAGWGRDVQSAQLALLWPPDDLDPKRNNDASLVLRVTAPGGRRLLLCGDIGDMPMQMMLAAEADVKAEVCELPHHGAWVDSAATWIDAVRPRAVLQSAGRRKLSDDRWSVAAEARGIERYVTARDGMVSVVFAPDGGLRVNTFR